MASFLIRQDSSSRTSSLRSSPRSGPGRLVLSGSGRCGKYYRPEIAKIEVETTMSTAKSTVAEVMDFLASVKLALIILFALAVAAVGGTVIPQNLPPGQYIQGLGPRMYTFLSYLDMFDMYHSWWFNSLLGLLLLNLAVCSIKRLPQTVKLARPLNAEKIKPDFLTRQSFSAAIPLDRPIGEALPVLRGLLGKNFGRPGELKKPWGTLLWAEKGAFSRYGVYLVHCSIFFIIAGGIVGNWAGFEASLNLHEGQTADQVMGRKPPEPINLPFALRLDRFVVKFYESGAPSEYRSEVTIIENGKEVGTADIRVNHPLTRHGITFYQSSYGQSLAGGLTVRLRKEDGQSFDIQAFPQRPVALPGEEGSLQLLDFVENLMDAGPAARLLIRPSAGEPYTDWAFAERPSFIPKPKGPYDLTLLDHKVSYYTGLQVNKDPGVWFTWTGCGLMLIGFIIAFFFSHQKIFAGLVEDEQGGPRLILAGSANRNRGSFQIKFDKLRDRITGPAALEG